MDPFDDFISDDRKTVSEGFSSRKLKFPPTGLHGSRSDNGDRRLSKSSDSKGRKGAISNRTSKLAQLALTGEETPNSYASTAQISSISSSRSSLSSQSDLTMDFATTRSRQIAEMMEVSAKLNYQGLPVQSRSRTNSPTNMYDQNQQNPQQHLHSVSFQYSPQTQMYHNLQTQNNHHIHQQHLAFGGGTGRAQYPSSTYQQGYHSSPASMSSMSPASQTTPQHQAHHSHSTHSTPMSASSQHLYNKVNPVATGHALDPLACESRDSEEEFRLANAIQNSASGDANAEEAYDTFPSTMVPIANKGDVLSLKIILLGDKKTGKSSLLKQYFDSKFDAAYTPTDGLDNRSKRSIVQGRESKVQVWDASISPKQSQDIPYFKGTHCFGIVYDILDYATVETVPNWIHLIKDKCGEDVPIVLIGNKLDRQGQRAVGRDSIQQYAIDCGLQGYIEVSAKTQENVIATMDLLAFLALERYLTVTPVHANMNRDQQSTLLIVSNTDNHGSKGTSLMPSGLSSASEDALLTKYQRKNNGSNKNNVNGDYLNYASPLPRKKTAGELDMTLNKEDPGIDLRASEDDSSVISSTGDAIITAISSSSSPSNLWTNNNSSSNNSIHNMTNSNHHTNNTNATNLNAAINQLMDPQSVKHTVGTHLSYDNITPANTSNNNSGNMLEDSDSPNSSPTQSNPLMGHNSHKSHQVEHKTCCIIS